MEDLLIREATPADKETLLRFEQGVIEAERPFDETLRPGTIHYYDLDGMLTAPHIALLVAEYNGRLIGSGYARIETAKPYLQHTQYAYLGFMYVEPAFRGKGVNKAILAALEKWALDKGVTELRLEVITKTVRQSKPMKKPGLNGC